MTTLYTIMSYGGIVLAVLCFIAAIILFIKWDIPKIFGDITGRTEKKTIKRIQREGYETNVSKKTAIREKQDTGTIRIRKTKTEPLVAASGEKTTAVLNEADSGEETTTVLNGAASGEETTTVLNGAASGEETTTVLNGAASGEETTTVLSETASDEEATAVLDGRSPDEEVTTVLSAMSVEETALLQTKEPGTGSVSAVQTEGSVEGVIQLPDVQITDIGTVARVLDFMIAHTDEEIT